MTPGLQQWFERLERQKRVVLSDLSRWSESAIRYRPEPAAWAALDVVDHLVKVEKASLEGINNQLPNGVPVTLKNRIGGLLVISVMKSPMRIKVPASVSMVLPQSPTDQAEIARHWDEVRAEMGDLLRSLQPSQLRCGVFQHPVSGWMTMPQAMAFLSAHLRHHGYQLRRLKNATRGL